MAKFAVFMANLRKDGNICHLDDSFFLGWLFNKGADTSDSFSEDSDGLPAKSRRQRRRAESVISIPPPPPLPPKEVEIKNDKPIKKNEVIKPKPISRSIINTNIC